MSNGRYERYNSGVKRASDRVQEKMDAEAKAADPLAFYWKKGCNHIRRTFFCGQFFNPQPEDFYNEGNY